MIYGKSGKSLYGKAPFSSGFLIGLGLFLLHTKYLYGIYTLNQAPILLSIENSFSANYSRFFDMSMFIENIIFLFEGMRIILFSQEFGLIFFAPILFLSFVFVILLLNDKKYLLSFSLLVVYTIPFMSIIVVQNTHFLTDIDIYLY